MSLDLILPSTQQDRSVRESIPSPPVTCPPLSCPNKKLVRAGSRVINYAGLSGTEGLPSAKTITFSATRIVCEYANLNSRVGELRGTDFTLGLRGALT